MKIIISKQLMKNKTNIVSGEEEYCDQLYRKQPKGLGKEVQWNIDRLLSHLSAHNLMRL